ncbi:MAG: hypothetical protein ACFFG0_27770 [Candidatus Thorarchaeota archaeon]
MIYIICSIIMLNQNSIFTDYQPLRNSHHQSKTLSDIMSHISKKDMEQYGDDITNGHELTHVINNRFGNNYKRKVKNYKLQALYVLDNKIVILQEPKTKISKARKLVPPSLRGTNTYELYTGKRKQPYWDEYPLYLFNEWVAYTNGSIIRHELGIKKRGESVQYMLELSVYSLCVIWESGNRDEKTKDFTKWYLKRTMEVYNDNLKIGGIDGATKYLKVLKYSDDTKNFRKFLKNYLGEKYINELFLQL